MAEKEMHKAVCAECGKECGVPFKPTQADLFTAENAGLRKETPEEDIS